jgi:hypothetical protein
MIQYCFNGWMSLGVHVDLCRRYTGRGRLPYGPYLDFHIACFIFSIGYHPIRSTDYPFRASVGRGGVTTGEEY